MSVRLKRLVVAPGTCVQQTAGAPSNLEARTDESSLSGAGGCRVCAVKKKYTANCVFVLGTGCAHRGKKGERERG